MRQMFLVKQKLLVNYKKKHSDTMNEEKNTHAYIFLSPAVFDIHVNNYRGSYRGPIDSDTVQYRKK